MRDKLRITLLFSLVFGILLVNPVNADMLTSDSGVIYDSNLLRAFEERDFANNLMNNKFYRSGNNR